MDREYYLFPQDENLVVLVSKDGKEMPTLSDHAIKMLTTARSNAHRDGWSMLPWQSRWH